MKPPGVDAREEGSSGQQEGCRGLCTATAPEQAFFFYFWGCFSFVRAFLKRRWQACWGYLLGPGWLSRREQRPVLRPRVQTGACPGKERVPVCFMGASADRSRRGSRGQHVGISPGVVKHRAGKTKALLCCKLVLKPWGGRWRGGALLPCPAGGGIGGTRYWVVLLVRWAAPARRAARSGAGDAAERSCFSVPLSVDGRTSTALLNHLNPTAELSTRG